MRFNHQTIALVFLTISILINVIIYSYLDRSGVSGIMPVSWGYHIFNILSWAPLVYSAVIIMRIILWGLGCLKK